MVEFQVTCRTLAAVEMPLWLARLFDEMPPVFMVFILVVVVVLPLALGSLIGRKLLKLKDLSGKIGLVLLTASVGLLPFVMQSVIGIAEQQTYAFELKEWNQKGKDRRSNKIKISDAAVRKLKDALPDLTITVNDDKLSQ